MSRFNSIRFIKDSLEFNWVNVDDWDDVDNDIKLHYCASSMNIGREDDVIIEWMSKGGKVYLKDDKDDYQNFECGYGNIVS